MNYFDDFPIEFKQINPEDFPQFEVSEKSIISPNSQGYIKDALNEKLRLGDKNTVVINAGVGQGKTHAIIDIVKQYYEREEFVIFIASPFVSLVEQYYNDVLEKGIPEDDVFRYEVLGNEELPQFWRKRIHIVTANCLLGNPGEDAFINSQVKRYYLNRLSKYCETKDKKVVFIYDEIHDTIHNFKEQYIFNLWKWRKVIHKNFIISATYNEASKVVIEYLAELTNNKIQIIESERKRFLEKQSELFLHYNSEQFYNFDDKKITELVGDLISVGKEVDILSYSKKLAENIIKNKTEGIGAELYKKYLSDSSVTVHAQQPETIHSYWMTSILVKDARDRESLRDFLKNEGIETRPLFYPVHTMPMYETQENFRIANSLGGRGINLPSWPGLTNEQVVYICEKIKKYFAL
mgnify:CR=1 FL=1